MAAGSSPLADVRVVEEADGLAASYAGYLLSELGAEVIRVEPAATRRAPGDHVVHRGKRSVLAGDACLATLRGSADVLLGDGDVARAPSDGSIVCRVTGWGPAGHPCGLPADEALVGAQSGIQALQWAWDR